MLHINGWRSTKCKMILNVVVFLLSQNFSEVPF
jgi:hypothetical protein